MVEALHERVLEILGEKEAPRDESGSACDVRLPLTHGTNSLRAHSR
jgi:hypothetical protein